MVRHPNGKFQSQEYPGEQFLDQCCFSFSKTTYLSPLATSVPSLPMTQLYILLANRLRQAVPLSALTLMQQQLGRTDGECYSAPRRANIF